MKSIGWLKRLALPHPSAHDGFSSSYMVTSTRGDGGRVTVLVALAVLSKPPRISARAPIPDSLAEPLRRQGALTPGDAALYVFSPRGADDTTLLLVARRTVAVVTPHRVRAYRRDSVQVRYGAAVGGGLSFRMVLTLPRARRDTVFRHLSFRDVYELASRLGKLIGGEN